MIAALKELEDLLISFSEIEEIQGGILVDHWSSTRRERGKLGINKDGLRKNESANHMSSGWNYLKYN